MKALLVAAALAIPVVANADDPNRYGGDTPKTRTQSGSDQLGNTHEQLGIEAGTPSQSGSFSQDEVFSKDLVVQKINKISQKHIELGNLAKSRASSDDVRRFGNKLVKDSEMLSKVVTKYAKDNNILLSAAPYLSEAKDTSSDSSGSASRSGGTMGGSGTDDTIAGRDVNMGTSANTPPITSDTSDKYGQTGVQPPAEDFQEKLAQLRNLQGTEFDSQFLSNVIQGSERALTKLNGWKGQGDKGLDRLIDRAVKMVGDEQKEALRLQGKVPAA